MTQQDNDIKQHSLIKRLKHLFNWDVIIHDIPDNKVNIENFMEEIKKIPYRDENGNYNIHIDLKDIGETNRFIDHHVIENAAKHKPNADCIVNVILAEISRTSPYSQDLQIKFKSKNGWKGYLKLWLYPQIYYGKPSGNKTDFSEIFLVEKDPTFSNWESIYYRDSNDSGSYEIHLNTFNKWDRYCSHYSGICSVSWLDFVNI